MAEQIKEESCMVQIRGGGGEGEGKQEENSQEMFILCAYRKITNSSLVLQHQLQNYKTVKSINLKQ